MYNVTVSHFKPGDILEYTHPASFISRLTFYYHNRLKVVFSCPLCLFSYSMTPLFNSRVQHYLLYYQQFWHILTCLPILGFKFRRAGIQIVFELCIRPSISLGLKLYSSHSIKVKLGRHHSQQVYKCILSGLSGLVKFS